MQKTVIAVAGSLAQRPGRGGHAWVFLQYLLGFQRLGYEVVFIDRLDEGMAFDHGGRPVPVEESAGLHYLRDVMHRAGLADCWSLLHDGGRRAEGLARDALLVRLRRARTLVNVMGFLDDEELLAAPDRRVFLDIDPGFGQMWRALGLADLFQGHDHYATIGENIGQAGCTVPTVGVRWIPTRQPVVLENWPVTPLSAGGEFTSVGSWRGPFGPVDFEGRTYGLRVHEFRRFLRLPAATGARFRVALDIDQVETADLAALDDAGWQRSDPLEAAGTPDAYRAWIQSSAAELMVAKNMYVETRGGWFSDRSTCYLASGRPVLAQDTGLSGLHPVGEGLLTFSSFDEAVEGVRAITADPARHSAAARRVAQESFDSDRVLTSLLERVG